MGVGGGHGGGQNARQDQSRQQRGKYAVPGDELGDGDDDGLGGGGAGEALQSAGADHAVAHDADENGDGHGDDHPNGAHPAGDLQLVRVFNGHEPQQNVGHTEIAQAPGHGGDNGQQAVGDGLADEDVAQGVQPQVSGHPAGVVQHGSHAAGRGHAEHQHRRQGYGHDDGLDQVGDGSRPKTAQNGVAHDDDSAHRHAQHIVPAEQRGKQLAAGGKAGGCVGHEKHQDDQGRQTLQQPPSVSEALGEELGHGDGAQLSAVAAQALGYQQPVEIGAQRQARRRPEGVGQAVEKGQSGQAHQQPGAHVRGLGAHGGDIGAQLAAAQVKIVGAGVPPGVPQAHAHHE